ncbi:MAG TPA: hypothetical protein VMT37_11340 [Solirubrobacterales bacterium]|nr:hypothetical protein [Solirubrobacterales bacterium]
MRKTVLRTAAVAVGLLLVAAGSALAIRLHVDHIVIETEGGFTPTTLPKHGYAPIKLHGYGKISTDDGSVPPVLEQLTLWFDKHGEVQTRGLPVCRRSQLESTDTKHARQACGDALVGKGIGKAIIYFPESKPIPASSPILLFNGPPKHGNPTVLAHAYLSVPAPTTYIVQVEIQRVHDGRYGFKTVAKIPKIADGSGVPIYGELTIGRRWTYKGKRYSYANAGCPDGRLQAKGQFRFRDGTFLQGTVLKKCKGTG